MTAPEFDEREWCPPTLYRDAYLATVARGRERMAKSRVVLCGLARDLGDALPAAIERLVGTLSLFGDYRVVLYENDSADDTLAILQSWAGRDNRVTILTETLGNPKWGSVRDERRMHDLAFYRNRYRDFALSHFGDFEFMLVIDPDLAAWSDDGLANSFGHDDWDMMGANGLLRRVGRPVYWDAWAYRDIGHPEPHWYVEVNHMTFPRGTPPVPVLSCFGGLAVYRMPAMHSARYEGGECEHVRLHKKMCAAGFSQFYFNPSMIVLYPDWESLYPDKPSRRDWWRIGEPR